MIRRKTRKETLPRTLVGRYLYAGIVGDREDREHYTDALRSTFPKGGMDQLQVARLLGSDFARMMLAPDQDVRDIGALVEEIRGDLGDPSKIGYLEAEALIRSLLGEEAADVTDIDGALTTLICVFVAIRAVARLALSPADVAKAVIRAEGTADDAGLVLAR